MLKRLSIPTGLLRLALAFGLIIGLPVPANPLSDVTISTSAEPAPVRLVLAGTASLNDPAIRHELATLSPRLTAANRQALIDRYYHAIIAGQTDLEAFARIAELAADLNGNQVDGFVADLSRLALDAMGNRQALFAGAWGRLKQHLHAYLSWFPGYPALGRFGSAGFAADDGSNQVQHFWYSVAIAYGWGTTVADLEARYHEWNAPGILRFLPGTGQGRGTTMDLALSRQGIVLGRALAAGTIQPRQVGAWMRQQIGR